MKLLIALTATLSAAPRGRGILRWQTHLSAALAGIVTGEIATMVGHALTGQAFRIVALVSLVVVVAGIVRETLTHRKEVDA